MSRDLEDTVAELGAGYGELVARLRAAYEVESRRDGSASGLPPPRRAWTAGWRTVSFLVAASLLLALAVSALFVSGGGDAAAAGAPGFAFAAPGRSAYTAAYRGRAAAEEMVRSQKDDGSWGSDFITRQNAAALRDVEGATVAYRKALRYLRSKGLSPLTDAELRARGEEAALRCRRG